MLLAALVFGCSDSKPEDTELKISYVLPEGRTCQTYLADYFEVTWYDSEQRKIGAKEIPCDSESADSLTLLPVPSPQHRRAFWCPDAHSPYCSAPVKRC